MTRLTSRPYRITQALLSLLWVIIIITMIQTVDAQPPSGGDERGANVAGVLTFGIIATGVEFLMFSLLTRAWFTRASGGALVLTWGVFAPWTLLSVLMSLHGGSVLLLHLLWLGLLLITLSGVTARHIAARLGPPH